MGTTSALPRFTPSSVMSAYPFSTGESMVRVAVSPTLYSGLSVLTVAL